MTANTAAATTIAKRRDQGFGDVFDDEVSGTRPYAALPICTVACLFAGEPRPRAAKRSSNSSARGGAQWGRRR